MTRRHLYTLLFILFLVGWAFYSMYPWQSRDLFEVFQERAYHRDTAYTNIVQTYQKLAKENPSRTYGNLKRAVDTNDLSHYFPEMDVKGEKEPSTFIINQLQRTTASKFRLGLDLQGGVAFVVEMQTNKLDVNADKKVALDNAVEVLRKRVDKYGVAEPLLQVLPGQNRIEIQMPGVTQDVLEDVRNQIRKAAVLEFRWAYDEQKEGRVPEGIIPAGYQIMKEVRTSPDGQKTMTQVLVAKERVKNLTGKNVNRAYVSRDNMNNPVIAFGLDSSGAKIFGDITSENIGRQLAIILDGELYSAPVIRSAITGGSGEISGGNMSEKDAFDLANALQNPLEVELQIIDERMVDPGLGADAVASGIRAAIFGTLAVAAFMTAYYMLSGFVADIALIINVILLLGVMCSINTTFTLPGIAGIVLTAGMAVDANVLIFERIREESAKGKSLKGALAAGYARAFSTIFDSHVTTLISSIILIYMGTGTVKGFGVSLTIGVAASLFTALVVTRLVFDFLINRGIVKTLPMFHLIRGTKINFMKIALPMFVATWTLIIVGCGYGIFARGVHVFGTDFLGGDNLSLAFTQKVEVEQVRKVLTAEGVKDPQIQYQREVTGTAEKLRITTAFNTGTNVLSALQKHFPTSKFSQASLDKVGPTIGKEIQKTAIIAILLSLFGILIYVAFRYELPFGVGAVFALVHDVLLTIGVYCLSGREFNATTVAAILTIIGFSTNDTIVIFDRIREDLKLGVRGSFKEIIDQAINQTLSRTLITSGTVFIATMALFLFGGGAINDFAFIFLIGILTGTYSSIYMASALVLWWHKGERPAIGTATVATIEQVQA